MKQFVIILHLIFLLISNNSYGQVNSATKNINDKAFELNQTDSIPFLETPKKITNIVNKIVQINEVHSAHVGFSGSNGDNFENYLVLKNIAQIEDLVKLTDNKNPVVACYASWALVDKSYPDLKSIFLKFLLHNRQVSTFSGCIKSRHDILGQLYHHYWNKIDNKAKATDKMLLQLDSIILYNENSDWLLMTRALENRIYPASYKIRIENLAFKKGSREALFYLSNWYKADNYENIKKALITYFKKADFSKTGVDDYYRTLDELLKFRDSDLETIIIQKLKKDKHWKYEENRFKSLLDDYGIYENFD